MSPSPSPSPPYFPSRSLLSECGEAGEGCVQRTEEHSESCSRPLSFHKARPGICPDHISLSIAPTLMVPPMPWVPCGCWRYNSVQYIRPCPLTQASKSFIYLFFFFLVLYISRFIYISWQSCELLLSDSHFTDEETMAQKL